MSYNTREMTVAALRSVESACRDVELELIVVDNASSDGSADAIADLLRDAFDGRGVLIASPENLGFGRANNVAAERAVGQRLLLLNPDTLVLPGAVRALLDFADRTPSAGIWGGRTYRDETRTQLDPHSAWRRMTLWSVFCYATGILRLFPRSGLFNPEGYGSWDRLSEREVDIVTGCFFLIDRGLWDRLGGFDPRFFMYAEEADLCLRARKLGARPRFTPAAEIVHFGGASERYPAGKIVKLFAGKISLAMKHWSSARATVARWLYLFAALLRMTIFGAVARITRRPSHMAAARTWSEVWARRKEWSRGFPDPDPA